jgi:hypothetical protein
VTSLVTALVSSKLTLRSMHTGFGRDDDFVQFEE